MGLEIECSIPSTNRGKFRRIGARGVFSIIKLAASRATVQFEQRLLEKNL